MSYSSPKHPLQIRVQPELNTYPPSEIRRCALDIYRNKELPVFQKLGDVHSEAIAHGQIAVILHADGQFSEAIEHLHKMLPFFQSTGDESVLNAIRSRIAAIENIGYRLGVKQKYEGERHEDRDAQFNHIARTVADFQAGGRRPGHFGRHQEEGTDPIGADALW